MHDVPSYLAAKHLNNPEFASDFAPIFLWALPAGGWLSEGSSCEDE